MEEGQGWGGYFQRLPSPFKVWQEAQGLPIYRGAYVSDLYTVELAPWARLGQAAAFVSLADQEEDSALVVEIAPGQQTEPLRHLFEMVLYVVDGRGATTFWQDHSPKQTVEWQRGSVFAPPLNCHYQHFNLDRDRPARLFMVSNLPQVMNLFHEPEFVFDCPYVFRGRYAADDAYFGDPGKSIGKRDWQTNFIPDVRSFELVSWNERGSGAAFMQFRLGYNTQMACHVSAFPPGSYKKAHRHGVGAHLIILDGVGYSLLWREGEDRTRVDWRDGTVLSPREMEYHQHFNTGPTAARYLAIRFGVPGVGGTARVNPNAPWMTAEELEGIPYEREDPAIPKLFVEECARNGAPVLMKHPAIAGV